MISILYCDISIWVVLITTMRYSGIDVHPKKIHSEIHIDIGTSIFQVLQHRPAKTVTLTRRLEKKGIRQLGSSTLNKNTDKS